MPQCDPEESTIPEKINKDALERYAASQTRWGGGAALLRGFRKSLSESGGEKDKRRRRNVADTNTSGAAIKKIEILDACLSMLTKVLGRANAPHLIPGGMCEYITQYKPSIDGYMWGTSICLPVDAEIPHVG